MKKTLRLFVLLIALISLSGVPVQAKTTAKNWYKKELKKTSGKYKYKKKTYKRRNFSHYAVVDINKDGTKELVLSNVGGSHLFDGNKAIVLTYYKKKVKPLLVVKSNRNISLSVNKKTKTLAVIRPGSSEVITQVYKLKSGALKTVKKLEWNRHPYTKEEAYQVDGKYTSYNKYNGFVKKYDLSNTGNDLIFKAIK